MVVKAGFFGLFLLLTLLPAQAGNKLAKPLPEISYGFPVENPFLATIAETPPQLMPDFKGLKVEEVVLNLPSCKNEHTPDIFQDVDMPEFKLAWHAHAAPLVFVIAGTGGRYDTAKVEWLKKVYFKAGYHVIQLSSPTSFDFIVSSSTGHRPGISKVDSADLYHLMQAALARSKEVKSIVIKDYFLTGYSLGALNAAFIAHQDSIEKKLGFKRVLMINPPVNLGVAMNNLDRMMLVKVPGVKNTNQIFENFFNKLADYFRVKKSIDIDKSMLFELQQSRDALTSEEMVLLIATAFRFSIASMGFTSDVMTGAENIVPKQHDIDLTESRTPYFKKAMSCNFNCYLASVLLPWLGKHAPEKKAETLIDESSLTALRRWLHKAVHVGVMHNADDFIIDQKGLDFLYNTFGQRLKVYPLGGHVGNLGYWQNVNDMLSFMATGSFRQRLYLGANTALYFIILQSGAVMAADRLNHTDPLGSLEFHDSSEREKLNWERQLESMAFMDIYDPLEPMNRVFFKFNKELDHYILMPLMNLYGTTVPSFVQMGISNFFQNLKDLSST